MTGVGSLRSLEVLALHNNHLEKLDKGALQPLARLQVFTLAHNNLSAISDVSSPSQTFVMGNLAGRRDESPSIVGEVVRISHIKVRVSEMCTRTNPHNT